MDGEWCVGGDFNAVSSRSERKGSSTNFKQAERTEFVTFIEDMQLIGVPSLGKKFTSFHSDGRSMSRIDRFLLSEGFISNWNISAQLIGDRDISHHCPIWLISTNTNGGPKPFKFNNCWVEHKEFMSFVKEYWESFNVEGSASYKVKEKLKMLKGKLKWWNKEVFRIKDLRIDNLVKDMNELEMVAADGGPLIEQWKALNAEIWQQTSHKGKHFGTEI